MAQETTKRKSKIKIVLWSIFGIFISFLVIMEASLFYQKVIKKSPTPTFMGFGIFHVITGSMNGTSMMEGDLIIIKRSDEYKVGDIVLFMESDTAQNPTTHRIIYYNVELDKFVTKGDANSGEDKPIAKEQIVGKVVFVISGGGYFFDWLGEEKGWVYVVAIIVIAGFVVYMLFRKNGESEDDESNDTGGKDKDNENKDNNTIIDVEEPKEKKLETSLEITEDVEK